jgi:alkylhydroperoxidase family enzyme
MKTMHLPEVADNAGRAGAYADLIRVVSGLGQPYPPIWHLFAYKPAATRHLERFTQEVMRGPSPLSPGLRELIAAYTSKGNDCEF